MPTQRISMVLTLCFFFSSCNASFEYEKNEHDDRYVKPKLNWAYWYADQYANSNQGVVKTDFAKIDCHLAANIIYWEPSHIQFGRDYTYDWVDKGMKYG